MLVEITKVPSAENSAIHLHPTDNVAVARVPIPAGAELVVGGNAGAHRRRHPSGSQGGAVGHRGRAKWWSATGRRSAAPKKTIAAGRAHPHAQPGVRGTGARLTNSPLGEARDSGSARPSRPFRAMRARTAAQEREITSRWWRPATAPRTPPKRSRAATKAERLPPNVDGVVAFPARRRLRPRLRPGRGPVAPHTGRRADASQRFGGGDPRAWAAK